MTLYGYARVSSKSQKLDNQINQLLEYGVSEENIYKEKTSGRSTNDRDQFNSLIDMVKEGDTIVVTKLDRFARSTKDALNTIEKLKGKGVSLVVLNVSGEKLDTSTPTGKLMVTVLSAVAEFEADMIRERQLEGIERAKKRGVYKGRPRKYTENNKALQHAIELYSNRDKNGYSVNDIANITKVSRATIYRAVKNIGVPSNK